MNLAPEDVDGPAGIAFVKAIVFSRFGSNERYIEADDLIGYGLVGLVKARLRFDPEQGATFSSWAWQIVVGAIRDGLRQSDPLGRRDRQLVKKDRKTRPQLRNELGREPTLAEAAAAIATDPRRLARAHAADAAHLSVDEPPPMLNDPPVESLRHPLVESLRDDHTPGPEERLLAKELRELVTAAVAELPARERDVLVLHAHDHTFADIARSLGVTESRACQISHKAALRLRARLDGLADERSS